MMPVYKQYPPEWKRTLDATKKTEAAFYRSILQYLDGPDVSDAALARAIDDGPDAVAELMAGPDADAQLLADYTTMATAVVEIAGSGALKDLSLSISFNLDNPYSGPWMALHGAQLVKGVGSLTRQAIRTIVSDGFTDHKTVAEMTRQIRGWVGLLPAQVDAVNKRREQLIADGYKGAKLDAALARYISQERQRRARNIARTETVNAHAQGTLAAWRDAAAKGLIRDGARKVWIAATASDRTCPICKALDGKKAALDQPIDGHMAPTAHPSCRCALALTWK